MKSFLETLAALSTGAVLLSGCGASPAPVNASEVPAATEAKPSAPAAHTDPAAHAQQAAPAMPATAATPASTAKPTASAPPSTSATPAAKPKKTGAKKTNDNGSCGAGTCG